MAEIKPAQASTKKAAPAAPSALFSKNNFMWMIIGGVVIALGMLLMTGGKSKDPNVFTDKDIYSTLRITVAPILILLGFVLEIYAIFQKPKQSNN